MGEPSDGQLDAVIEFGHLRSGSLTRQEALALAFGSSVLGRIDQLFGRRERHRFVTSYHCDELAQELAEAALHKRATHHKGALDAPRATSAGRAYR